MDAAKAAADKAARRSEWLHDEDVPIATNTLTLSNQKCCGYARQCWMVMVEGGGGPEVRLADECSR